MSKEKTQQEKKRLHARNRNQERYDLGALISATPELANHIKPNKYGEDSIDFSNPIAVRLLNQALLKHYYGINHWEFPKENLCPPIPGRADYIHYMADLLGQNNYGKPPTGDQITCLDVGVGASCIYPIIGVTEYDWNFIGSDIDPKSIASAKQIVDANTALRDKVECRLQKNRTTTFKGIIDHEEKIDLAICNPPFHASLEEAQAGTRRKVKNLTGKKTNIPQRNFSGISHELIAEGGEAQFIQNMAKESKQFSKNCLWFSTLVSKQSNLKRINHSLKNLEAKQIKTFPMGTGNKSTRIIAWTFLSQAERKAWRESRWEK